LLVDEHKSLDALLPLNLYLGLVTGDKFCHFVGFYTVLADCLVKLVKVAKTGKVVGRGHAGCYVYWVLGRVTDGFGDKLLEMLRALDEFLKNEFQRGLLLLEKLFSLRNRLENCGQLFRAILLEAVEL
jgi:hypothetical protein